MAAARFGSSSQGAQRRRPVALASASLMALGTAALGSWQAFVAAPPPAARLPGLGASARTPPARDRAPDAGALAAGALQAAAAALALSGASLVAKARRRGRTAARAEPASAAGAAWKAAADKAAQAKAGEDLLPGSKASGEAPAEQATSAAAASLGNTVSSNSTAAAAAATLLAGMIQREQEQAIAKAQAEVDGAAKAREFADTARQNAANRAAKLRAEKEAREAEERRRLEAERAREEAERARQEAEERARVEAEERVRRVAEELAQAEAEAKAQVEARERERQEAEAAAEAAAEAERTEMLTFVKGYNAELASQFEELCREQEEMHNQIKAEEKEKADIQTAIEALTVRVAEINQGLALKRQACEECDKTIEETEAAYKDIMKNSQNLLENLKTKTDNLKGAGSPGAEADNAEDAETPADVVAAALVGRAEGRAATELVVIAGPPAAGKGTQCEKIKAKYGYVHISTGDILRENVKNGTELGKKAEGFMKAGALVPSELIVDLVKDRLERDDVKENGCLLDGFPRAPDQAQAMLDAGLKVQKFLLIDVPDEELVVRGCGRRLDPETGEIYHLKFKPPPAEVVDRLVHRSDDQEEAIRNRLKIYREQVNGILPFFKDVVSEIDGTGKPDEVFAMVGSSLDSLKAPAMA